MSGPDRPRDERDSADAPADGDDAAPDPSSNDGSPAADDESPAADDESLAADDETRHDDEHRHDDGPPTHAANGMDDPGPIEWFFNTNEGGIVVIRDILSSVGTVVVIGLVLFGVSGLWPPLVAVESGSMQPHMHRGDLVFIMNEHRFPSNQAVHDTGVVTYRVASHQDGYWSFGSYGNVIVYQPNGRTDRTPIIHRARFYVKDGENWVDSKADGGTGKANLEYMNGATTCAQVTTCPAPHAGFVTLGDHNGAYDQAPPGYQSTIVKPEWVRGRAKVRIPWIGYIRLLFGGLQTGVSPGVLSRAVVSLTGAVGLSLGLSRAS